MTAKVIHIDKNTHAKGVKIDKGTFLTLSENFQKLLLRDDPELSRFFEEENEDEF